jgi:putative zinc finger/helix-turn-helix YgiT family protein
MKCRECGDEVLDPSLGVDPFNAAYEEYRKRHALLTPGEITNWRGSYNLTQNELAGLIGIGTATLSRYESGSLQEESLDRLLRFTMEPSNLLKLVERSEGVFKPAKKERLIKALTEARADSCSIDTAIVLNLGGYQPDEFSGYRKLDLTKLYNAILFFCKNGVVKTKLNKLLFYADFKHYKEYGVPITGARYAHIPFGPGPDNYEIYFASLNTQKAIQFEEEIYTGYVGENIKAIKEPTLGLFTTSELKIMASVAEHFDKHSASEITKFSHKEVGYQETENGELISYTYAAKLNY